MSASDRELQQRLSASFTLAEQKHFLNRLLDRAMMAESSLMVVERPSRSCQCARCVAGRVLLGEA